MELASSWVRPRSLLYENTAKLLVPLRITVESGGTPPLISLRYEISKGSPLFTFQRWRILVLRSVKIEAVQGNGSPVWLEYQSQAPRM
jgi:hypothetical protein